MCSLLKLRLLVLCISSELSPLYFFSPPLNKCSFMSMYFEQIDARMSTIYILEDIYVSSPRYRGVRELSGQCNQISYSFQLKKKKKKEGHQIWHAAVKPQSCWIKCAVCLRAVSQDAVPLSSTTSNLHYVSRDPFGRFCACYYCQSTYTCKSSIIVCDLITTDLPLNVFGGFLH